MRYKIKGIVIKEVSMDRCQLELDWDIVGWLLQYSSMKMNTPRLKLSNKDNNWKIIPTNNNNKLSINKSNKTLNIDSNKDSTTITINTSITHNNFNVNKYIMISIIQVHVTLTILFWRKKEYYKVWSKNIKILNKLCNCRIKIWNNIISIFLLLLRKCRWKIGKIRRPSICRINKYWRLLKRGMLTWRDACIWNKILPKIRKVLWGGVVYSILMLLTVEDPVMLAVSRLKLPALINN